MKIINNHQERKSVNILVLLLVVVFITTACGSNTTKTENKKTGNNEMSESKKVAQTFNSEVEEFNKIYKKALLATGKGKTEEAESSTKESYEKWKSIVKKYAQNQPAQYKKETDWVTKLKELENIEEEATELTLKGELKEAHEKLELIRKKLMKLRQDNGIKNISDDMLIFHDVMEEVVEAETMKEALTHMQNLKIDFARLKEYNQDNAKYKEMVKNLENVIIKLNGKDEERFNEAKTKLKPAFIALYMQFG